MKTLILDATTKTITAELSAAPATTNPDVVVSYADYTSTTLTHGGGDGVLNGTTPVTIVSAPAASTQRIIKSIFIQNRDTAAVTVIVKYNNNSTLRQIAKVTLAVNDEWTTDGTFDANGNLKTTNTFPAGTQVDGQALAAGSNVTVIAPGTHAATSKATPIAADELPLVDSAASNILKKLTWANLKATLFSAFTDYSGSVAYGADVGTFTGVTTGIYRYYTIGKIAFVELYVYGGTLSNTPSYLTISLPAAITPAVSGMFSICYVENNGTFSAGMVGMNTSGPALRIYRDPSGTAFTTGAGGAGCLVHLFYEIA